MHVALSEAIHYACKSKKLIRIMYHLSLSTSYNEVKKILQWHNIQLTDMSGSHLSLVPPWIVSSELLHEARDQFDQPFSWYFKTGKSELCNEQTQISQKVVSNMGKNKIHSNISINLINWYQAPGMGH